MRLMPSSCRSECAARVSLAAKSHSRRLVTRFPLPVTRHLLRAAVTSHESQNSPSFVLGYQLPFAGRK